MKDMDEQNEIIDSILPTSRFERKGGYAQNRSMSVSAAGSYNNMNSNIFRTPNNKPFQHGMNGTNHQSRRGQGRAMSMQISSNPFIKPLSPPQFIEQRRRKSMIPRTAVIEDEIAPLTMNKNQNKKRKHRGRHMSVPTNLMSDNVLKKKKDSVWINDYEGLLIFNLCAYF